MYRKILVPLDGSKLAECVLPHVEALAKGCQVQEVIFARVHEPFRWFSGASDYVLSEREIARIESEQIAVAEKYLKEVVNQVHLDGLKPRSELLTGPIAESIAEYAAKNSVDLIIIATHGRSGVGRWVWGSVADRILRSSCVPVLMVRAPGCVPGI
jgi:nucleotide-binding universal stress UspA family protein